MRLRRFIKPSSSHVVEMKLRWGPWRMKRFLSSSGASPLPCFWEAYEGTLRSDRKISDEGVCPTTACCWLVVVVVAEVQKVITKRMTKRRR